MSQYEYTTIALAANMAYAEPMEAEDYPDEWEVDRMDEPVYGVRYLNDGEVVEGLDPETIPGILAYAESCDDEAEAVVWNDQWKEWDRADIYND